MVDWKGKSHKELLALAKNKFTEGEIKRFQRTFDMFDENGDGDISLHELDRVMERLGQHIPRAELQELIADVDVDGSGRIEFPEFLMMMALPDMSYHRAIAWLAEHQKEKNAQQMAEESRAITAKLNLELLRSEMEMQSRKGQSKRRISSSIGCPSTVPSRVRTTTFANATAARTSTSIYRAPFVYSASMPSLRLGPKPAMLSPISPAWGHLGHLHPFVGRPVPRGARRSV